MDAELQKKFDEQQAKLDAIFVSVEKMRRYFQWTLILTVVFLVLPLIGLIFAIPYYLNSLSSYGQLLNF